MEKRKKQTSVYLTSEEVLLLEKASTIKSLPFSSFIRSIAIIEARKILGESK